MEPPMRKHGPEEPPDDDGELFRWAESQRGPNESNTIREAFEKFNRQYPEVYAMFEQFALEGIRSGMEMMGAGAVWERMRWETHVRSYRSDVERYRLNNNFRAYYARLFMERHPEHAGVFKTRRVRS